MGELNADEMEKKMVQLKGWPLWSPTRNQGILIFILLAIFCTSCLKEEKKRKVHFSPKPLKCNIMKKAMPDQDGAS